MFRDPNMIPIQPLEIKCEATYAPEGWKFVPQPNIQIVTNLQI